MSDRLTTDQSMANDAALVSADGRYAAYLQSDANLVLCYTKNSSPELGRPYWSSAANAVGDFVNGSQRNGAVLGHQHQQGQRPVHGDHPERRQFRRLPGRSERKPER